MLLGPVRGKEGTDKHLYSLPGQRAHLQGWWATEAALDLYSMTSLPVASWPRLTSTLLMVPHHLVLD